MTKGCSRWRLRLLAAALAVLLVTVPAFAGEGDDLSDPAAEAAPAGGQQTEGEEEEESEGPRVLTSGSETIGESTLEVLRSQLMLKLGEGEQSALLDEKLTELIDQGDPQGNLEKYMENMIRLEELEQEMERLLTETNALVEADAQLQDLSQTADSLLGGDDLLFRVQREVNITGARLLKGAGFEGDGELLPVVEKTLACLEGSGDPDMASAVLFAGLIDSGLLSEVAATAALDELNRSVTGLKGKLPVMEPVLVEALNEQSQKIAARANNATALSPDRLVSVGKMLTPAHPLFVYDGAVMLSAQDAAAFLEGELVEIPESSGLVIQLENAALEMVRGSSDGYLNDKLLKMDVPVLVFDGVCYLPLNAVLTCGGLESLQADGTHFIYKTEQEGG